MSRPLWRETALDTDRLEGDRSAMTGEYLPRPIRDFKPPNRSAPNNARGLKHGRNPSSPIDDGPIAPQMARSGLLEFKLRDWLAGMALQGVLASDPPMEGEPGVETASAGFAFIAYRIADAMLAERAKAKP